MIETSDFNMPTMRDACVGATRFNETTLSLAVSASKSLRTTVVAFTADKLNLTEGDTVGWNLGGKIVRIDKGGGDHTSKVVRTRASYRTTVLAHIVNALRTGRQDVLVWDVDKECRGGGAIRWYATIRKNDWTAAAYLHPLNGGAPHVHYDRLSRQRWIVQGGGEC